MELSSKVLESLCLLGDTTYIPDNVFERSINLFCKSLIDESCGNCIAEDTELSKLKQGALKQAHAAFLTFVLEITKHDSDEHSISPILEDCKIPGDRIDKILAVYKKYKSDVQVLLSSTSHNPPHVVDVNWSLQHSLKKNYTEKVNQPEYLIDLKTESVGEQGTDTVQFSCTQEQLQDLVGKLKDACKSLERTAQQ